MQAQYFLLIFTMAALWAPSFLFIKIAVPEIPPLTLTFLRLAGAVCLLGGYLWLTKFRFTVTLRLCGHFLVIGLFSCALPFSLINYAELYIETGTAAILNGLTPIVTVIMAHFFIAGERLTLTRGLGQFFGLLGFLLVLVPIIFSTHPEAHNDDIAVILMAIAASSYAFGIIYARKHAVSVPTLAAPLLQLTAGALIVLPFTLWFDHPFSLAIPSAQALAATFALILFGTVLAFILYFRILAYYGAVALSMVIYLFPIFAVILGHFFLDEQLSLYVYLGGLFILCGMILINRRSAAKQHRSPVNDADPISTERYQKASSTG